MLAEAIRFRFLLLRKVKRASCARSADDVVCLLLKAIDSTNLVVEILETAKRDIEIVEQFLDRVIEPEKAGLSEEEADALLRRLVAHTRKPEFHYFHSWRAGDMVLWDNWRAMHCTKGTKPGVKRLINRTTIAGDVMLGRQLEA